MTRYRFARCSFDPSRRELLREGEPVKVSPRAFEALHLLLRQYPNAVSKEELYATLWPDAFVELTNLNNVIAEIRSAVGDSRKKIVTTKHRFGYVMGEPVFKEEERAVGPYSRFTLAIGGKTVVLLEGENLVGRSGDVAVLVDLPSISRHHAVIRVVVNRVEVQDLHSKNGTFIGKNRVNDVRELRDRDTICFGRVCGVFRAVSLKGTTVTETSMEGPEN